jgi:hypothetical protein
MAGCLVCDTPLSKSGEEPHLRFYDCPRCGLWDLPGSGVSIARLQGKLGEWDQRSIHLRSHLSHILRRQQRSDGGWVRIPLERNEEWKLDGALPGPSEQLEQLIIWIGDRQSSHAESASVHPAAVSAWIGAAIIRSSPGAELGWLLSEQSAQPFIVQSGEQQARLLLRLTMRGWAQFDALKRGHVTSRRVLMAMKFGDEELNRVLDQCFRPAVARTGFELRVLSDHQPAGLIDDQLRVALRTSRFILADLTHGNNGAYWEAGFAEGLGRPVIYTCRDNEWSKQRPHFDTNHMNTIVWSTATLAEVAERLTQTIRATIPDEARMTD